MKVRCIDNTGYPASLELGKEYEATEVTNSQGALWCWSVIDESGESYLYPKRMFAPLDSEYSGLPMAEIFKRDPSFFD